MQGNALARTSQYGTAMVPAEPRVSGGHWEKYLPLAGVASVLADIQLEMAKEAAREIKSTEGTAGRS